MTLDDTLIKKLASLKDMIDKFVNQRNMCNKTMKIMAIELEKMHVFVEKLGQHINKNTQQTSSHIDSLTELRSQIDDNKRMILGGARELDSKVTIMHQDDDDENVEQTKLDDASNDLKELASNIELQIKDLNNDRKTRDKKYQTEINKTLTDMDLSKAEMKKKIKSLTTAYTKKNNAFNKDMERFQKALTKAKEGHYKLMKDNQSAAVKQLSKQDKLKFIDLLSKQIEDYESDTKTEMVNISEVWDELKNSIVGLKKSAHMPSEIGKSRPRQGANVDIEIIEDREKVPIVDEPKYKHSTEQLILMDQSKPYDNNNINKIMFTHFGPAPLESRLDDLLKGTKLQHSGITTKQKNKRGRGKSRTAKNLRKGGKKPRKNRARSTRSLLSVI